MVNEAETFDLLRALDCAIRAKNAEAKVLVEIGTRECLALAEDNTVTAVRWTNLRERIMKEGL